MNNGDLPFMIEAFDGLHAGMEADFIVDRQDGRVPLSCAAP